jgi:hypothetical protein
VDTPFTINGSLRGGDFFGLGEAGCAVVRHEFRLTGTGASDSDAGEVLHSWDQVVLDNEGFSENGTMTTAQWVALGSPGTVRIWVRSYTCNDFSFKEDFCSVSVL